MKRVILIISVLVSLTSVAQKEVPFTLDDRDRLIRLEVEQEAMKNEMNTKLEDQQRQINDLKTMFTWGFSVIITLMLFILGYIIWDRRTAMTPLRKDQETQKIEIAKIKAALKEMGESDQKIAEILKRASIF